MISGTKIAYRKQPNFIQMNSFTKHLKYTLFIIAIVLTACTKDEEPTPVDPRDQYVGSWVCAENSKINGQTTFNVNIKKNTADETQILIDNFYNYGFNKSIYITLSSTTITIPQQTFSGSNTVNGTGTASSASKINLTYYVKDGASTDTCTSILTK